MMEKVCKKKIIIFGAGNFGKLALEYYGKERVFCFVDNNATKVGTLLQGKKIISYEEYLEIERGYRTVIATNAYSEIADQLRNSHIFDFDYYSPQYIKAIEQIYENKKVWETKVALLGIDECTEILLNVLLGNGKKKTDIYIAETEGNAFIGCRYLDYAVVEIDRVISEVECILVSSPKRAFALQAYIGRIGKEMDCINPFIQKKYYDTKEIIYNPYEGNNKDKSEQEWIEANSKNPDMFALDEYVRELYKGRPLFEHVEIETINRCNGGCEFCPVSVKHDIREKRIMDEALFISIIDQLAELNYAGRLAIFSNNEPFLDDRIIRFNQYAREKLPKARLHLFTNGTLMTLDKFVEIIEYLDELIIDNYNQNLELIQNSKAIKEYCDLHPVLKEKVTIVLRKPKEILTSRGGDAPNRTQEARYPDVKCGLPFKQLIIRPDGKVSLCCNDPYGRCTLGDLTQQSILEVWTGKAFEEIREKIMQGRKAIEHCCNCDTFILF